MDRINHQADEVGISQINVRAVRDAIRRIKDDPLAALLESIQYAQAGGECGRNALEQLVWLADKRCDDRSEWGYLPARAREILQHIDGEQLDAPLETVA